MPADFGGGWFVQTALVGLLMLAILVGSVFALLLGVVLAWRAAVLTRYGIRVEGRVVGDHVEASGSEGPITLRIVEFTDLRGNTQRHKLRMGSDRDPPVGRPMRLVYNPSDPSEVSGASFTELWMVPLGSCVCGAFGVFGALYAFLERLNSQG